MFRNAASEGKSSDRDEGIFPGSNKRDMWLKTEDLGSGKGVKSMNINLYTNYTNLELKDILIDNDAYFNENILARDFGGLELEAMKKIDGAILLDKEQGTVKTPRGITSIEHLSTGCKTILNFLYLAKREKREFKVINVTQCGWNVLEELFAIEETQHSGIGFLLLHRDNLHYCNERNYVINNNKHIRNLLFI